jgi:outer membrane lipoprotein SlyB
VSNPGNPAATLVGAVAGGVAGAVVFGAMISLGGLLSSRVGNPIPLIVLAVAGAYAGWLLGVIVFGAVRGGSDGEERT